MNDKPTVPSYYDFCIFGECPKASTCLRHTALPMTEELKVRIFNPHMLNKTGKCPYYVKAEKVFHAKGLKGMMEKLPYGIHKRAVSALMSHFSERTYYRVRKGDRLLSPDEQKAVRRIITRLGYTDPWEFDAYVEDYLWEQSI